MLRVKKQYESAIGALKAKHGLTQACMLERMAVLPALQGKGVGTLALRQALAECDAAGWPCLLATNEQRNVKFYERLGFAVIEEDELDIFGHALHEWWMVRKPEKRTK